MIPIKPTGKKQIKQKPGRPSNAKQTFQVRGLVKEPQPESEIAVMQDNMLVEANL